MTEEKESGAESDDVLQAAEKSFNEDKREDEWRNGIRERNRNTVWKGGQGGMDLSKRDRNIQKTQKLKGMIKRMADNERDALLSGVKQLDLSMHISEFADAISDSNFKLKDIQSVVQLCSELHVWYEDFSKSLADGLMKRFVAAESDMATLGARRRAILRFCVELVLVEVFPPDAAIFLQMMDAVVKEPPSTTTTAASTAIPAAATSTFSASEEVSLAHLVTVESLCKKYGIILLGRTSDRQRHLENLVEKKLGEKLARKCILLPSIQEQVVSKLGKYYECHCRSLLNRLHASLLESQTEYQTNQLYTLNQPDSVEANRYRSINEMYQKVRVQLSTLSEVLGLKPLEVDDDRNNVTRLAQKKDTGKPSGSVSGAADAAARDLGPWQTEVERWVFLDLSCPPVAIQPHCLPIALFLPYPLYFFDSRFLSDGLPEGPPL
eukprot:GHVU01070299.1.p1 GENE.GHVU01070299.1~~GHVU01070299.1.p1  ORF type:complete len:437 (-),score=74.79 GHVU01070299.1:302-1612(-)